MISLSTTISRLVIVSLLFPSAFGVSLGSHGAQNDLSTLLNRLNELESKVASLETLKDEVVALTTELRSQNELVKSLEAQVTRSRFLAGDECLLTFANVSGTPTCSVPYQLIAESGLQVVGEAAFETAQFTGSVVAEDTVEFLSNVTFQDDANMTFNGRTVFNNRTSFNNRSTFNSDAEFNDEVSFYADVFFEDGADVSFEDSVVFFDDVTIDGPRSGTILFDIKDGVDVKFRQSRDMIVETATTFYKNVKVIQKPCSGKGSASCSNSVPTLLVAGDITGESDIIVEGELQVDAIAPFTAGGTVVVNGNLDADAFSATSIAVGGAIAATGLIKGGSLESTSTIIAAGNITSTGGIVSPVDLTNVDITVDLTNKDITVRSLTATNTVVSQGSIIATTNITVSGLIQATGDVVAAGLIKGGSLESSSTIIAAGDITSTAGFVSPVDLSNKDITVNSLTASNTIVSQGSITASTDVTVSGAIQATGDITTDGNFVDTTP